MPRRAVLDTNLLLSAVLYGGTPLKLVNLWRQEQIFDLVISPELLAEFVSKLKTKFVLPDELVFEWQKLLSQNVIQVLPTYTTQVCRDSKDDMLIDTALAAKAEYLVTGDKDLLDLKKYKGLRIVKAKHFLNLVGK